MRDYDRERTSASPLVVAPGTVLLLDESGLAPGQLGQQGTASLQVRGQGWDRQSMFR